MPFAFSGGMRTGHKALLRHLLVLSAQGLAIAAVATGLLPGHPLLLALPVPLFLAAFAANHDAMHGSLAVSRPVRDGLMTVLGGLMLVSGHALRVGHFIHHRRPLAEDDLEGKAATMPLWRAILAAPGLMVAMRRVAWQRASSAERRWQAAETALNLATGAALAASGVAILQVWLVVALGLQIFMPVWAGHIPHRAPAWIVTLAQRLAVTGSPTLLSLGYHELHHRHPKIPTAQLHAFATGAGPRAPNTGAVGWHA